MPNDLVDQFKHILKPEEADQIRRLSIKEAAQLCCAFVMLDHAREQLLQGSNIKLEIGRRHQTMAIEPAIHRDRITSNQFVTMLPQADAA